MTTSSTHNGVTHEAHIVKDTSWCVIDIDKVRGRVFVQQRWEYNWQLASSFSTQLSAWTYHETHAFHHKADTLIWGEWSNRVTLTVSGTSAFARQFSSVPINFDIKWVLTNPHWEVTVTKIPPSEFARSFVDWSDQTISLDTGDIQQRQDIPQYPVAHEFGHTLFIEDEYPDESIHANDRASMMNIGNELRERHLVNVINELNTMMENTTFRVKDLQ